MRIWPQVVCLWFLPYSHTHIHTNLKPIHSFSIQRHSGRMSMFPFRVCQIDLHILSPHVCACTLMHWPYFFITRVITRASILCLCGAHYICSYARSIASSIWHANCKCACWWLCCVRRTQAIICPRGARKWAARCPADRRRRRLATSRCSNAARCPRRSRARCH